MGGWVISWTRSATRHRISRRRSGYVVRTTGVIFREPARTGSPLTDDRLVFLGPDEDGVLIEVMAVETERSGLLIIHAMPIRHRYLNLLTGGM
jgi:hypothetical protein